MAQAAPFLAMAGVQMAGGILQAGAIKQQGKYAEQQANFNARMADLQAEDAIRRGDKTASDVRKRGSQVRGSQRAALAGQGVDVGFGSAMDLQDETTYLTNLDVLDAKNNAWRESFGYRVQATNYRLEGKYAMALARQNAKMTILNAGLGAAQTGMSYMGSRK